MADYRSEWFEWRGTSNRVVTMGVGLCNSQTLLQNKDIIIIIPGNPGLAEFYVEFMQSLQVSMESRPPVTVWSVAHAGHDTFSPSWLPTDKAFNFEEQIEHKLDVLASLIPTSARITLVGHSIGCKIIMEMFRRQSTHNIVGSYFLFPTIEQMKSTVRGKETYPLTSWRVPLIILYTLIFLLLPDKLILWLIRHLKKKCCPSMHDVIHRLSNPNR